MKIAPSVMVEGSRGLCGCGRRKWMRRARYKQRQEGSSFYHFVPVCFWIREVYWMGNLGLVQCSNGDEVGVPKFVLFEALFQILVTEMDNRMHITDGVPPACIVTCHKRSRSLVRLATGDYITA